LFVDSLEGPDELGDVRLGTKVRADTNVATPYCLRFDERAWPLRLRAMTEMSTGASKSSTSALGQ
jgi:hypothetical protein